MLHQAVKKFLDAHWDGSSPLLLGCSGGSDSKALLYLLHAWKVPLHVAHVDHGWRKESSQEAETLCQEVARLGLPFHLHRLVPASVNKEAAARKGRLEFFQSLFEKAPFQALVLGHHAADVAETCLKRIAEGAHLPFLGGMAPKGSIGALPVFRPLLFVEKRKILRFLEREGLSFFRDPTDFDVRSQMRKAVFPLLEKALGKSHLENWSYLAERSFELREYLERKVGALRIEKRAWGSLCLLKGVERVEARYFLQKILSASREEIEAVLDAAASLKKRLWRCEKIWVHRGWVAHVEEKKNKLLALNDLEKIAVL